MATNILMPALSPTMTEGTLSRWLKKEGENVRAGDVIAEIETDKATMEVEAVDEGVLGKILVTDGTEGVKVNEPIAILVDQGEAVPASAPAAKPAPTPAPPSAPAPEPVAKAESPRPAPPSGNGHDAGAERVFVSPLARRMAKQAGLELTALKGSGPNGRIVKADIEAALQKGTPPAPQPAAAPAAAPVARPSAPIAAPHTLVPHSSIRKVIARRLTEAKSTIPHFYVSMDVEIDALIKLMNDLNAKSPKEGPDAYLITINDLVIKASAVTLRRVPTVNAAWTDEGMALFDDVEISREMKDLAGRARAGKLKPEEFQGGGFSISNMGMFGVTEFAAIINPPQSAILAVAAGQKRPVVKNDSLAIATVMTCTLSVDHRVVDGALGARWLREFKRIVEDPLSLLL
jgi:pyruvate dehydrogenase E2 component (dihydrolipoamide acetyltransferase)